MFGTNVFQTVYKKKKKPHNLQVFPYLVSDQTAQKKNKRRSRPVDTGPSSQGWLRRVGNCPYPQGFRGS